jgi:hypothetical protein
MGLASRHPDSLSWATQSTSTRMPSRAAATVVRARRLVPGKHLVHIVELREPGKVGHVSVHLYDVFRAGSRGLQNRPHVLERLAHLVRVSIRHIARLGVYGALTRDEHEAVGNNGVRVGIGRSGSFVRHDGSPHRSSFVDRARKLAKSSGPLHSLSPRALL